MFPARCGPKSLYYVDERSLTTESLPVSEELFPENAVWQIHDGKRSSILSRLYATLSYHTVCL